MIRQFEFERDEAQATNNVRKHRISFELARTIFDDPRLLTIADLDHSQTEDRWLTIGCASNGALVSVAYLWIETISTVKVRIISARKATQAEIRYYQEGL